MKWIFALLVLAGMAFAGQIVNVGEDTGGGSSPSAQEDSECYAQYFQCLRDGCAAAGGQFNELTQGCYNGDDAKFSEAVGKCADASKWRDIHRKHQLRGRSRALWNRVCGSWAWSIRIQPHEGVRYKTLFWD